MARDGKVSALSGSMSEAFLTKSADFGRQSALRCLALAFKDMPSSSHQVAPMTSPSLTSLEPCQCCVLSLKPVLPLGVPITVPSAQVSTLVYARAFSLCVFMRGSGEEEDSGGC